MLKYTKPELYFSPWFCVMNPDAVTSFYSILNNKNLKNKLTNAYISKILINKYKSIYFLNNYKNFFTGDKFCKHLEYGFPIIKQTCSDKSLIS